MNTDEHRWRRRHGQDARATVVVLLLCACLALAAAPADRPRIAFFPLGGTAKEDLRAKVGFSLRAKLDRTGTYEVIDGAKMAELAGMADEPITLKTAESAVRELGALVKADVLVWGEMTGNTVKLNLLDLRQAKPAVRTIEKVVNEPTDLRFVSEEILQTLPGVAKFAHPSEEAVQHDELAEKLWATNPNLVVNGDFAKSANWNAIYQSEKYIPPAANQLPRADKVAIVTLADEPSSPVLAMRLSRTCAENNGMACLSDAIRIEPDTRYRLSFRYKSDGPRLHVFVKGYTMAENIKGEKAEREIYRRQVPPTGSTNGQWVTIVDELNPQHVAFPVQHLRIDLYAYLHPGLVMFDDVVLKAVGKQTRTAADEAIDKPVTRPGGARR